MKTLRFRHICIAIYALGIAAFHLLSGNRVWMNRIADGTLPVRQCLARLCSHVPFSVAELLCTLGVLAVLSWLVWTVVSLIRQRPRLEILWRRISLLLCTAEVLYLLLCVLLGASYRADGFQEKSGLRAEPESVEMLYAVTERFVQALNSTVDSVPRSEDGQFAVSQQQLFEDATSVFRGVEALFPFLTLEDVTPKQAFYSHIMTVFNYTGFYFPYTGEAHINTEPTAAMLPATIAHEMSHQRGIASEQEANFVAILTCTESGNSAYAYSGWLFGFIHLGNALYRYDRDAYFSLLSQLSDEVLADLRANDAFWAQYESNAAVVSQKVYDTMLKSYGQELGVRSYGAVVDLLIAWYRQGGFGA